MTPGQIGALKLSQIQTLAPQIGFHQNPLKVVGEYMHKVRPHHHPRRYNLDLMRKALSGQS
jgi:hypothetical protein